MLRVVLVNAQDIGAGFRPDVTVPILRVKDLKELASKAPPFAVALMLNEEAEEPHPYSPGGLRKLTVNYARRLANFAMGRIETGQASDDAQRRAALVEADRKEYHQRVPGKE